MNNASFKKGGASGGDTVLESRHLIGLFLGVVVLCGVFFTLGYVMGRTQYESSVNAAGAGRVNPAQKSGVAPQPAAGGSQTAAPGGIPPEWDFYKSGQSRSTSATNAVPGGGATTMDTKPAENAIPEKPAEKSAAGTATAAPKVMSTAPVSAAAPPKPAAPKPLRTAPVIPRGAVVLQVAVLTREGDALALADALQQKKFPSYVLGSGTGNLFRVQVGPYADVESANLARRALEREGFKAILKR